MLAQFTQSKNNILGGLPYISFIFNIF